MVWPAFCRGLFSVKPVLDIVMSKKLTTMAVGLKDVKFIGSMKTQIRCRIIQYLRFVGLPWIKLKLVKLSRPIRSQDPIVSP